MCATQNRETICEGCLKPVSLDEAVQPSWDDYGIREFYHPDCLDEAEREADETARSDAQTYEQEHKAGNHNER